MIKISDVIQSLVEESPFFLFGFHHRLLNLSQVARFVQPIVEARCKKEVQSTAILMSLLRLQKKIRATLPIEEDPFYIDRINIHAGLASITYTKSPSNVRALNRFFTQFQEDLDYITFTQGISEITAIVEKQHLNAIQDIFSDLPRQIHRDIAGLGVKFKEAYTERPGLLYQLLQQLALQNINVVEISSTMTEFNIYVDGSDLMLAFDSIYYRFSQNK